MNASYKNSHINETLDVLSELSKCKPRPLSERKTRFESIAENFSKWNMKIAVMLMIPAWGLAALSYFGASINTWVKLIGMTIVIISCLLANLALLMPVLVAVFIFSRWKDISLENLLNDIRHEQAMVYALSHHKDEALIDAKCWLELEIKRIEARIVHFFGNNSAVLGLLASGYFFLKEFRAQDGSLSWIGNTINSGATFENVPNIVLMMIGALVVGLSLGAVMIRSLAARYRYQVQLIDMAKR